MRRQLQGVASQRLSVAKTLLGDAFCLPTFNHGGGRVKRLIILAAMVFAALGLASFATADTQGSITFESYNLGNINGQQGWSDTGLYDANVVAVTGGQALQISNAKTSGSFGDQTFAPPLATGAAQGTATPRFTASFSIGTTTVDQQTGLSISVSPDNGQGARMSYLRFDDQVDGVHVFFDEAKGSTFKETDIATLSRGTAHTVAFSINFTAASSKQVTITIDNSVKAVGATWASYYQTQEHNPTSPVKTMLFRAGGTAVPALAGHGYLIDDLTYASS
jgi:hypothetical protein